ncbi:MAG: RNA polymerase sigma factor [Holophagales bacterium]|nr:RNA polymerase sigma factor [Holophagales bacterium]
MQQLTESFPRSAEGAGTKDRASEPASRNALSPESLEQHVERAIEDFQAGRRREESFRILFEVYFPPLRSFFSKRVSATDDQVDLIQETFTRVYKGLGRFRGEAPFGAWLFRIAWNVLRDSRGRSGAVALRARQVSLDDVHGSQPVHLGAEGETSALSRIVHEEQRETLRSAIARLPNQRRRCMVLWAYHELTYEQIARVMQLSLGTVKAHLAQARRQLEVLLQDPLPAHDVSQENLPEED